MNIGDVVEINKFTIGDDDAARTNHFQIITIGDYDAGIFAETNADGAGLGCHGLSQPVETPSFIKVRIDNHPSQKTQSCCDFYFSFQITFIGVAFINHRVAHGHSTCAGPCYDEVLVLISVSKYIEKSCSTKD